MRVPVPRESGYTTPISSPAVVPTGSLLAFAATAFVLIVVPGPSVLFVISRGVALGGRAAVATVLGNAAGAYAQVVVVALGLGALIERSATLFTVVKLVGAAYLVFLGLQTVRHRRKLARVIDAVTAPRGTRRILREGFVVGITNPKAAVFMAAVLPQFTDPARGHVPLQLLTLGLVFVAIAVISDSTWGLAAGYARVVARPVARGGSRRLVGSAARHDRARRAAGCHRPPRLTRYR